LDLSYFSDKFDKAEKASPLRASADFASSAIDLETSLRSYILDSGLSGMKTLLNYDL
jgi:hypothetical protein